MNVLTLRIHLNEIDPEIWRCFQVNDTITLYDLHAAIQIVMGWQFSHLHDFQIEGKTYSEPSPDDEAYDPPPIDERNVILGDVVNRVGQAFQYVYDMGDYWLHTLTVEAIEESAEGLPRPLCLAGERECPPEDCGGTLGYCELLEALNDPEHEEHESCREWVPPGFDAEHFSVSETNEALNDGLPPSLDDDGIVSLN